MPCVRQRGIYNNDMNIHDVVTLARQLADAHGFAHVPIRTDRSKTRLGGCAHRGAVVTYFTFSAVLMPLVDDTEVRDTILHEIAHAKVPDAGHGWEWKAAAIALGAKPEACKALVIDAKTIGWRYTASCACGEHIHGKDRLPHTGRICRTCKTRLNWEAR